MRHPMARTLTVVVAWSALALVTACGGAATRTLNGRVTLQSKDIVYGQFEGRPACTGGGGYADIIGGETVVVRDGSGKELARTELQLGQPNQAANECVFPFVVESLPEASQYALVIGNREPVPYTLDELRRNDFTVDLALRDPA